jgi:hypothetical protein
MATKFDNKFPKFIKLLQEEGLRTIRPLAGELLDEIQREAPVDSGEYQDSWQTAEEVKNFKNGGKKASVTVYSDDPLAKEKEFIDRSGGGYDYEIQGWARYAFESVATSLLSKGRREFQNLVNKI